MKKKQSVLCITAIRSEYYLQRPVFEALMNHRDLEMELIVAGAHLTPLHDYSVKEVEADGFPIVEKIENLILSDHDASRLKGAASQLKALCEIVDKRRPD